MLKNRLYIVRASGMVLGGITGKLLEVLKVKNKRIEKRYLVLAICSA